MDRFSKSMGRVAGQNFDSYADLHHYSVSQPDAFWRHLFEFLEIDARGDLDPVRSGSGMPGTAFFPSARLSFAQNMLRFADITPGAIAVVCVSESQPRSQLSFTELRAEVRRVAAGYRRLGVESGDRIAGVLPNSIEAVVAMLAANSIGALWSSCSPDFGAQGVIDRFAQIEPKVLILVNGYRYGGKVFDVSAKAEAIVAGLPSVEGTVWVEFLAGVTTRLAGAVPWPVFGRSRQLAEPMKYLELPFNHPLYIMYSSGTTGVPKCIVHGQGGTLVQHAKELALHSDVRAGDNLCFYTTTGWMMWNWMVSALFLGATVTLYDGAPTRPDIMGLWRLAADEGVTHLGTSPRYLRACRQAEVSPKKKGLALEKLRVVLSTGAPLPAEAFDWIYAHVKSVQLSSISGGTDLLSCFMLGSPTLPVVRGEIQALGLGMDVVAFSQDGQAVSQEKGELGCRRPFVSMPLFFWGDAEGEALRAAYFDRVPGVWIHGDYIKITGSVGDAGGVVVYGRSDATLNPGGVRIGSAEIYRPMDSITEVEDSIVVGLPAASESGGTRVVLFVQLKDGHELDDDLRQRIRAAIRDRSTARHVPDSISAVAEIPYTMSGKKVELAVRQVLLGQEPPNLGALANPGSLAAFRQLAVTVGGVGI